MRFRVRKCSKTFSSVVGEGSTQAVAYKSAGSKDRKRVSMDSRGDVEGNMGMIIQCLPNKSRLQMRILWELLSALQNSRISKIPEFFKREVYSPASTI